MSPYAYEFVTYSIDKSRQTGVGIRKVLRAIQIEVMRLCICIVFVLHGKWNKKGRCGRAHAKDEDEVCDFVT